MKRPPLPPPDQGGFAEYLRRMAAWRMDRLPLFGVVYDWRDRRAL